MDLFPEQVIRELGKNDWKMRRKKSRCIHKFIALTD